MSSKNVGIAGAQARPGEIDSQTLNRGESRPRVMVGSRTGSKRDRACDFFCSFFEHYLPRKLIRRYVYGPHPGQDKVLQLTLREMMDCQPQISLHNSRTFLASVNKHRPREDGIRLSRPFTLELPAGCRTAGTLGSFTVIITNARMSLWSTGWEAEGEMIFRDTWDFDVKVTKSGSRRTWFGEAQSITANLLLPGEGFEVTSVKAKFSQRHDQDHIQWLGGKPLTLPNRIGGHEIAADSSG